MPISRLAMAVLPILLVSSPVAQAASEVPDLDIGRSCRAAATAEHRADRSEDACRRDENRARDELQRKWPGFAAAEQARCTSLSHRGGSPSYVELLTCLEVAKQANHLPDDSGLKGGVER